MTHMTKCTLASWYTKGSTFDEKKRVSMEEPMRMSVNHYSSRFIHFRLKIDSSHTKQIDQDWMDILMSNDLSLDVSWCEFHYWIHCRKNVQLIVLFYIVVRLVVVMSLFFSDHFIFLPTRANPIGLRINKKKT